MSDEVATKEVSVSEYLTEHAVPRRKTGGLVFLGIVDELGMEEGELSLNALARVTGIARRTCSQNVRSLVEMGYLEQTGTAESGASTYRILTTMVKIVDKDSARAKRAAEKEQAASEREDNKAAQIQAKEAKAQELKEKKASAKAVKAANKSAEDQAVTYDEPAPWERDGWINIKGTDFLDEELVVEEVSA